MKTWARQANAWRATCLATPSRLGGGALLIPEAFSVFSSMELTESSLSLLRSGEGGGVQWPTSPAMAPSRTIVKATATSSTSIVISRRSSMDLKCYFEGQGLSMMNFTHLVVAMSSLGVASSSLAVSNMVRPKEVDSPPFTNVISWMKKSG